MAGRRPTPRACAQCSVVFTPGLKHPRASTCSVACRNARAYANRKASALGRACERCKTEFTPGYPNARFCSRECAGHDIADRRASEKQCAGCQQSFTSKSQRKICGACSRQRRLDRIHARNRRLRHLRRGAAGAAHSETDWYALLNRYRGLCAYCSAKPAEHKDHVIPISRGGSDSIGNILPACASCNLSKGGLLLIEWKRRLTKWQEEDRRQRL